MDIPPPPPPPPSPEDAKSSGASAPGGPSQAASEAAAQPTVAAGVPAPRDPFAPPPPAGAGPGGPPVPPAPGGPGGPGAPGGPAQSPYGGPPPYPQQPYAAPGPYQAPGPYPGQAPHAPGPYPAPGQAPGPYGYGYGYPGAGGWYPGPPQNQSTNGLAIASLTVSLAAFCLPVVALLLGVFGLRQIRRTGQRGRGLAIAGIVINSVATVLVALFVVLAVVGAFDEGNTDVQDIKVGQCFNTVGNSLSDYGGDGHRSTTVDVVPCGDEHDAEAYAVFSLDGQDLGDDYPGVDRISQISNDKCGNYADDYLGDGRLADGMDIYFYMPPEAAWDRGDRGVTCFFGSRGGKVTGSVRDGAGTSGSDGGSDGGSSSGSDGGSGNGSDGSDGGSGGDPAPSVGV